MEKIINRGKRNKVKHNYKHLKYKIMKKESVYNYKGKLIGYFIEINREDKIMIFEELPNLMPVEINLFKIDYILNFSDEKKPSSYYRVKN